MSDEEVLVSGISILGAVPFKEEFGKRTTLGSLWVRRNIYWLRRHFGCICLKIDSSSMDVDEPVHEALKVSQGKH